jgi:serine/threonine protein kinase
MPPPEKKKYEGMPAPAAVTQSTTTESNQPTDESKTSVIGISTSIALQARLQVPWKDITIIRQIGKGSYGKVCLGKWQHTEVAVKFCNDIGNVDEFMKEAELMMYERHSLCIIK